MDSSPAVPTERLRLDLAQVRAIDRELDALTGPGHPASVLKPGTMSPQGVAVAGVDGYLFIGDGANSWERHFLLDQPVVVEWLDAWRALLDRRAAEAKARGVALLNAIVPEKQVAYPDKRWPEAAAELGGRRPLKQLMAALGPGAPLIYPEAVLTAGREQGPTYFRHNSHWTPSGCLLAAQAILADLADASDLGRVTFAAERIVAAQDLTLHFFDPAPEEARLTLVPAGELTFDNRNFETNGRNTGSTFGVRNPAAPDPRRLILFGDSYSRGQGLAAVMSAVFAEVVFFWSKAVDWDLVAQHRADVVLWESAERFLATLPAA